MNQVQVFCFDIRTLRQFPQFGGAGVRGIWFILLPNFRVSIGPRAFPTVVLGSDN